jgi:hypothetical protein
MVDPSTPHGRLLQMVQSLAVGVDSFARAAATHGREGGVGEVQDYFAKQQQEKLQQEQATTQQAEAKQRLQEGDLRMRAMNAQMIMQQAAYHHALQMYPMEEKAASLDVLNKATASYKDALSEGYDIADPNQAALWRQMQSNIINIPFSGDQPTQEVLQTVHDAASKDGKSLTDYVPLTTYTDAKHGTGGEISLVPAAGLQQVQATPKQISTGMAQMRATLDTAKTALGADDPDVKALSGKVDLIQSVLDKGGKPSAYDFISLNSSVLGPLATRIGGATQKLKIQEAQANASKAQSDATKAAREADPVLAAQDAGLKAGKEAEARQQYEIALKKLEGPIAEGIANDKEAGTLIENNYVKPFLEKMASVAELNASLADAEKGNVAASASAVFKLAGITVPAETKRIPPEVTRQLQTMGAPGQRLVSSLQDLVSGDPWTPSLIADVRAFANDQGKVAQEKLRSGVKMTNVVKGTHVDPDALINASGFQTESDMSQGAGFWTDVKSLGGKAKKWATNQ